jgi:hypothetical protein
MVVEIIRSDEQSTRAVARVQGIPWQDVLAAFLDSAVDSQHPPRLPRPHP